MMGTSGKELFPRAEYTHCRSHALNLVVMHGCSDLPLVRNTMSVVEKIAVFFSATGARKDGQYKRRATKKSWDPIYVRH